MKNIVYVLLVAWVCAVPVLAQPRALSGNGIDQVSEYQDAAINYESAASTQESIADALLRKMMVEPRAEEERSEQKRRLRRNASFKVQGANQFMGAASNWDRAAKAWQSAESSVHEASARAYFQEAAAKCTKRATALIQQAAELTEAAALAYTDAGDLQGHISASQKAGQIRMKLARR